MKVSEYKRISNNVQVSKLASESYKNAMKQIREEATEPNIEVTKSRMKATEPESKMDTKILKLSKWRKVGAYVKVAVVLGAFVLLSGGTILSVKAYISHLDEMRNMEAEEVIELYENIFQYDSKLLSRAMSATEDMRYGELLDLYCRDLAEPEEEVDVISSKEEYDGEGIAFSTEDGILNLPAEEMTDEEILQLVEFNLLGQFVDYAAYVKASNPSYYLNSLEQMSTQEVDTVYINYYSANTETCFLNRELSFDESGRRKVLTKLYENGEKKPEQTIPVIQEVREYSGDGIAFCVDNCTFYFPNDELSDEELLQLIDFQIKVDYCRQRIEDEIVRGIRSDWPHIEYEERERIITLDPGVEVDDETLSQPWLKAYEEVLKKYYEENSANYENPERYYANVSFIYLNDDEIPEMLFSRGCTDLDYNDRCNTRNYLYAYKDGEAVLLTPGAETVDDFYGYNKPFSYVERQGMVYCDYHYMYGFSTYENGTDIVDNVKDSMSRMDVWDLDTLTCTSSNSNIEMVHAVYDYVEEQYSDAEFSVEYYINVSDVIRDDYTGDIKEIVGEKVDRQTYEEGEAELWNGETITTLSVNDYDKIYSDDNVLEALAKCYLENKM